MYVSVSVCLSVSLAWVWLKAEAWDHFVYIPSPVSASLPSGSRVLLPGQGFPVHISTCPPAVPTFSAPLNPKCTDQPSQACWMSAIIYHQGPLVSLPPSTFPVSNEERLTVFDIHNVSSCLLLFFLFTWETTPSSPSTPFPPSAFPCPAHILKHKVSHLLLILPSEEISLSISCPIIFCIIWF